MSGRIPLSSSQVRGNAHDYFNSSESATHPSGYATHPSGSELSYSPVAQPSGSEPIQTLPPPSEGPRSSSQNGAQEDEFDFPAERIEQLAMNRINNRSNEPFDTSQSCSYLYPNTNPNNRNRQAKKKNDFGTYLFYGASFALLGLAVLSN